MLERHLNAGEILIFMIKSLTHPMCIARIHMISHHFLGPIKYRIYQSKGNLFPSVNNRTKQARFLRKIISSIVLLSFYLDI